MAKENQSTPARVALAWLLSRPNIAAPISSATKTEHITDLVEATKLKLNQAALDQITAASAQ